MMKLLPILLVLFLTACAGIPSPFMDGRAELQVSGATKNLDPERILGTSYATIKALRAGTSKSYIEGLASTLDTLASGDALNGAIEGTLKTYVAKKAKYPEDKMLANYFIAKLQVKTDRLAMPLSPEQKRVLGVYADALRSAVSGR